MSRGLNLTFSLDESLLQGVFVKYPFSVSWNSGAYDYPYYHLEITNATTDQIYYAFDHIDSQTGALVPRVFLEEPLAAGTYKASLYGPRGRLLASATLEYWGPNVSPRPARNAAYYQPISKKVTPDRSTVIVSGDLPLSDKKYCSCLVAIGKRQTPECIEGRLWGKEKAPTGPKCYNPFPICTINRRRTSLGDTTRPKCFLYYNLDEMTDDELLTMALEHGYPYPEDHKGWNGERLSPREREAIVRWVEKERAE